MKKIQVRIATEDDVDLCLMFQQQTNEIYWKHSDFLRSVKSSLVVFLVAEENNIILGYCIGFITPTIRQNAILHETRVDVNRRNEGIGTLLVNEFRNYLFQRGVQKIFAEIAEEHIPFYVGSCGFGIGSDQWIEILKRKN